ncbi:MAG: iron hydrogenase [Candidatus Falkowbacteria bacterium]|nr:iron hydrogenase [Candidatus Falkowbacteria bacterium]
MIINKFEGLAVEAGIWEKTNFRSYAWSLVLITLISALPFFIHSQWITGPIINAVLIVTLFIGGLRPAIIASLIPSLMALQGGLLPVVLAPAIPFIMISNVILVLVIDFFCRDKSKITNYWYGLVVGASLKFVFLYFSVDLINKLLLNKNLSPIISQMMSWPQLITALLGGTMAYLIIKKSNTSTPSTLS